MDQNTHITLTYTWTLDDAKDHNNAIIKRQVNLPSKSSLGSWLTYVLLAAAIIVLIITRVTENKPLFPTLTDTQNAPSSVIAGLLPVIIIVATFWFIFNRAQKENLQKAFMGNPDGNKPVVVTINSDEIIMKTDNIRESRWKWIAIVEVMRTNKGFLFLYAPHVGFWIPIRAFQSESDINSLLELANHLTPKVSTMTF